jgi:hypothetical protein
MTFNLFALCDGAEAKAVKRVPINAHLQESLAAIFSEQETQFFHDITEEIDFDGAWKPDANELLMANVPSEASLVTDILSSGILSYQEINTAALEQEGIKALFGASPTEGSRILIQKFSARQVLSKGFSLIFSDNSFKKMDVPAFALDTRLAGVIENGKLKFKNFHNIRSIFDLFNLYKEATDIELGVFSAHPNIEVLDSEMLKDSADQTIRKLVHAIAKSGVLDDYVPLDIVSKAAAVGLTILTNNGKLVLPLERSELKALLRFLDDGLYEAPLSGERYTTNSKRKVGT